MNTFATRPPAPNDRPPSMLMLPALSRQPFGDHTLVRIGTDRDHVVVVPERSAYVHQIRLRGRDLLLNYPDGPALAAGRGHRNLALLPFPNRLGGGRYDWGGHAYAFPVNDAATATALHGFDNAATFALGSVDLGRQSARARLRYLHQPGQHPGAYPFLVLFEIDLALVPETATLTWRMRARNLGDTPAPVGLGWHPYFRTASPPRDWTLDMPPNRRVELARGLPTGGLLDGLSPEPVPIDLSWDTPFLLDDAQNRQVTLAGPDYRLRLEQLGETRFTQLFVPPTHDGVAIEPMSCGVDAFRQNPSGVALAPGAAREIGMRIVSEERE